MDNEPMWATDHVVALTPGSAINILETANEFAIKGNIIKIFYHGLSEITQEVLYAAAGGIFLYKTPNQAYQLLEDKVLLKLDWAKNQKYKPSLKKIVAFADEGSCNSNTDKIMARMDAMTLKMDAQYKELQNHAKKQNPILMRMIYLCPEKKKPNSCKLFIRLKQLNLGVGTERMIFNIDSAMKHSYSNDDTCFSIDVIDEILEEDFNALLNKGSKILHSIEGTLLEEEIFAEFDEFMEMTANKNSDSESDIEDPPFAKITINTDYKIKTSLEEPPMDLELKPLPNNLEYVFMEEPSFVPIIISSQLSKEKKNKLISVLKKHKQAFAWKTTYIPGICLSFCKHKIQLLEDKKPVVQKQRRLNPNMQEVVKKEIVKLLDTSIIYPITDSHWVSPIHYVPKKGGITVVTNENDELVPTRTIRGWRGIDFMGPFPKSYKFEYILVAVDYVSKWAEAQALPTNDARVVITFLKKLFCHFGMPKALISDRGTHFCNKIMEKTMKRYGVNHRFSTSYHPQTSGQVKNTNMALKRILEKTVKDNPAIWSRKLDDALWAFRTAYKTPTGTTPYKLIYGKNCHLPFEIEHRAYWALKNCNPDLIAAGEKRMFQLHELDELRYQAYENSRLYKERTKVWHDRKLRMRKEFKQGNKVLLFHSKYKFKQPKLRSRWLGPYVVKHQYPSGYVELYGKDGKTFIVNGHRLKLYHEEDNDPREAVTPFFPNK
ncbi:reverse transcriptase domain-containing protein [Tanacetum coccineum]